MILSLLLAAAAHYQALPYPFFEPFTPAPIVISQDNVELDGAGDFSFKPDPKAFPVGNPAWENGLYVVVRLWFDTKGQPMSCDIGQSPLPQAAQIECAQLMRSARFHLMPGMALPFRRGFVDIAFDHVEYALLPGPSYTYMPIHGYTDTTIAYPPDEMPADQHLKPADGAFKAKVTSHDYPPISLRNGFYSRSLSLLGISRDGRVQSCRPVTDGTLPDRTAYFDNYTCELFLRRGHFEFLPNAPNYDGLRYLRQTINWLPGR